MYGMEQVFCILQMEWVPISLQMAVHYFLKHPKFFRNQMEKVENDKAPYTQFTADNHFCIGFTLELLTDVIFASEEEDEKKNNFLLTIHSFISHAS